ncbi:MAG: hypothetical protein MUE31_05730 [Candidatus Nanopelagicales bacterium]|nr:hypothetical protein [Candidatus Nanopelagicales bacterium]
MPDSLKRHAVPLWVVGLSLLVLAPLLTPGYVLHLDMVFVPQQTLLPWNLGIGGGLPRSVPQDAVVSLVAGPVPGQFLQKAVLVGIFVGAGLGIARLAGDGRAGQIVSVSLYLWSAYMAARLLMGHWGLLWSFALLPWVVLASRRAREGGQWAWLVVLCAVGALVPTGGLILAVTGVGLAIGFGSRLAPWQRWLVAGLVLFVNAPWWLPALRSPVSEVSDPLGLTVFGARADGPGGVLLSVLAGGGVWNSQATLGSRTTWFAALSALTVLTLAVLGWRGWHRTRRAEALWLSALGLAGVVWAWLSGVADDQGWARELVSSLPGGGLLRDGQKWTMVWVLVLALCAPRGLERLVTGRDRAVRWSLAAGLALLPLATMPDLAAGGFGALRTSSYPQDWEEVRQRIRGREGDVLSLPWAPFRRYRWNHDDVVLDPMPRYLTNTVIWNDQLPVTVSGELVEVGGDDPRAAVVTRTIDAGRPLGPVLAQLGIGWVVVQTDQPAAGRAPDLAGMTQVWTGSDLQLWRVDAPVRSVTPSDAVVVIVDLAVAVTVAGLVIWLGYRRRHAVMS